jgi:hypothetical protein
MREDERQLADFACSPKQPQSYSRLRRLDALFAEKVLGHMIQPSHRTMTCYDGGPPVVIGASDTGEFGCSYGAIPYYTRDLGMVWKEAAQHFPIIEIELAPRKVAVHVEVERNGFESMGDADHPAEALVIVCLRAVGVSEEELT